MKKQVVLAVIALASSLAGGQAAFAGATRTAPVAVTPGGFDYPVSVESSSRITAGDTRVFAEETATSVNNSHLVTFEQDMFVSKFKVPFTAKLVAGQTDGVFEKGLGLQAHKEYSLTKQHKWNVEVQAGAEYGSAKSYLGNGLTWSMGPGTHSGERALVADVGATSKMEITKFGAYSLNMVNSLDYAQGLNSYAKDEHVTGFDNGLLVVGPAPGLAGLKMSAGVSYKTFQGSANTVDYATQYMVGLGGKAVTGYVGYMAADAGIHGFNAGVQFKF